MTIKNLNSTQSPSGECPVCHDINWATCQCHWGTYIIEIRRLQAELIALRQERDIDIVLTLKRGTQSE